MLSTILCGSPGYSCNIMTVSLLLVGTMLLLLWAATTFLHPKTKKSLHHELVVITGAGSGIGRLLALKLSQVHHCHIALWDLHESALDAVMHDIERLNANIQVRRYVCDVTDRSRVYACAQQVSLDFEQPVDILINNAGIVSGKSIMECDDAMMEKTVQVNTIAHFWTLKAFLPSMIERNHGHIVTIASCAGLAGVSGLVDYCASKYGAVGTSESLRLELRTQGKDQIFTTCVCPFYIKTGMFEGATSRFPLILPLLEPAYVADKIIEGIQQNEAFLIMPRLCKLTPILNNTLPHCVTNWIADFLGVHKSMDTFIQTRKY